MRQKIAECNRKKSTSKINYSVFITASLKFYKYYKFNYYKKKSYIKYNIGGIISLNQNLRK